ncbi:P-type conjugative transfer protein TrbG [Sphingosinicella rhizophila]|uniref:P-type conjugative transfer protein TrbG n=1 Tax=Sphingosinicella rhizophila TaxID=3050082 RepID=A0ABU3Q5A0_9SPHN|nr:P-type conjugative transfer protein TrbG [Sphingosinicella sp. GR2756]MDT9598593.1 P-type conjugative transfer protein TrbG [Sphingosinicella sp. GR2756]
MKAVLLAATMLVGAFPLNAQPPLSPPGELNQQSSAPATAAAPLPAFTPSSTPAINRSSTLSRRSSPKRARAPSPTMRRVRAANHHATQEPKAAGFVNAAQIYPYSEGALYRLYAAPERVTDIVLQPGETIISVAAGDTARWTVGDTTSGSGDARRVHILVKPFSAGLTSNMVITTDRRAYHVQLESTSTTAMASISWTYPQDELLAIRRAAEEERAAVPIAAGIALEQIRFGYAITGDAPPWRPLRAFDDGRQTYIEFPANISVGEAPPLFLLGADGKAQLVNYRMSGRFYIVDRLFDTAELRLGEKKQAIVRITRGGKLRRQDRRRAS